MAGVEQVVKGSLSPKKTHGMIKAEWGKAQRFFVEKKELATTSIDKLPLQKNEKVVFKSTVGSELNVDQKGKAALSGRAALIKQQIKLAGKALTKEQQFLYKAQAEAAEATGQFLEAITSGRYSYEQAFKKKNGLFFGYTVIDRLLRASLSIAEKGGDSSIALENIKMLEEFKEIPVVSAALAKNAIKITTLKSKAEDSRTSAFLDVEGTDKAYGEGASAGQGLPPDLMSKLGKPQGRN